MRVTISSPGKTVNMDLSAFVVMVFLTNLGRDLYDALEVDEIEQGTAEAARIVINTGWFSKDEWLNEVARVEAQNIEAEVQDFLEQQNG